MKLFINKKVGVSKEERALSYFKFYEQDMTKIPDEKIALLEKPQTVAGIPLRNAIYF